MADTRIATDTMKAFVFKQIGEVEVVKKPIPEPGPNETVVRTTTAMVCTTDVHNMRGAIPVKPNELGFDEIKRAFKMMESKEDGIIKPLIHFD